MSPAGCAGAACSLGGDCWRVPQPLVRVPVPDDRHCVAWSGLTQLTFRKEPDQHIYVLIYVLCAPVSLLIPLHCNITQAQQACFSPVLQSTFFLSSISPHNTSPARDDGQRVASACGRHRGPMVGECSNCSLDRLKPVPTQARGGDDRASQGRLGILAILQRGMQHQHMLLGEDEGRELTDASSDSHLRNDAGCQGVCGLRAPPTQCDWRDLQHQYLLLVH